MAGDLPRTFVSPGAEIADDVRIEDGVFIGPHVKIGRGTIVKRAANVSGRTLLGADNVIHSHACLGVPPQDLSYKETDDTRLEMGDGNVVGAYVTLTLGTVKGGGLTKIGSGNSFMPYSHVAHDDVIGDRCVLVNSAQLAGHVTLEDGVVVGAFAAIHQFVRLGSHSVIAPQSMIARDVPPYCIGAGRGGELYGLAYARMKETGFSPETLRELKHAYRLAFRKGHKTKEAAALVARDFAQLPEAILLSKFLAASKRGVLVDVGVRSKRKALEA